MSKKMMLNIDTTEAIEKIKEVQKYADKLSKDIPLQITVKLGDAIIFTHPGTLSMAAYNRLLYSLETIYPEYKVLILEENMRLSGCINFTESDNFEEHF